ncbi:hypothetical protein [Streptomyces sp. NPDC058268]|uniref:hypothetical protein n=1 Tax=Streptomyces sp. NPDC058268 TaxID=3346413 RepID=UPI0036EB0A23
MTYAPTKGCPHRWCRSLHILTSVVGLAAASQLFLQGVAAIAFAVMTLVLGLLVTLRIHGASSVAQVIAEEQTPVADGRIDSHWARIAVCMDMALAATLIVLTIDAVAPGGTELAQTLGLTAGEGFPWGIPLGIVAAVLNPAVHRRAGRPGPPRETVPRQHPLKATWSN